MGNTNSIPKQLPAKDFYDVVLDIVRIDEAKDGWPIQFSIPLHRRVSLILEKTKDLDKALSAIDLGHSYITVTVLGLFNKGKTHLINRVGGFNLASDRKLHTKGLSFAKSVENSVLWLDSAGTNSPLSKEDSGDHESPSSALSQKRTTEMLLQELSFGMADVIIVVVNELTWPDQEFLKALQAKLGDAEKRDYRQMVVVHNFNDVRNERDLLLTWQEWVISKQSGTVQAWTTPGDRPTVYLHEESKSGLHSVQTLHFCIGNDDSPLGHTWNPVVYRALSNFITARSVGEKPLFKDQLLSTIKQTMSIYCKDLQGVDIVAANDDRIPHSFLRRPDGKGRVPFEDWLNVKPIIEPRFRGPFKLVASGNLALKADDVVFDGFRILLTRSDESEFRPRYDIIERQHSIQVVIDIPGISTGMAQADEFHYDIVQAAKESILVVMGTRRLVTINEDGEMVEYKESGGDSNVKRSDTFVRQRTPFSFQIKLPQTVNDSAGKVECCICDGVAYLTLPKKKNTVPKPPTEYTPRKPQPEDEGLTL